MTDTKRTRVPSLWSSDTMDDFRKEIDAMFGNFLRPPAQMPELPKGVVNPAIDVAENDTAITMTAELPGLAEDDVDLTVRDGVLILKGEKRHEHDEEKDDVHLTERSYGSFQRTMPIPDRVDAEKIAANFEKGVLVVTMPKRAEVAGNPRKVKIGA